MPYPPTVVSFPNYDYDFAPFDKLSSAEKSAVEIIKSVLRSNGLPEEPLFFRYTDKYLTVGADKYLPFARLKLNKDLWYISLRVGDPDTGKNFRRFEISDVSDVFSYSSEIADAYKSLYAEISEADKVSAEPSDSELDEFFSNAKIFSAGKQISYKPTADEAVFFSAYVEAMTAAGLNWRAIEIEIMSDGALKVHGGRIKFGKRNSYMSYTKSKNSLATKEKNLSLSEYVERLKYWISYCLDNKDLFGL